MSRRTPNRSLREFLDEFADAVVSGHSGRICDCLVGRAYAGQFCGDPERDGASPALLRGIRSRADVRVVQQGADYGTAEFPDFRPSRSTAQRQTLRIDLIDGEWKITDMELAGP